MKLYTGLVLSTLVLTGCLSTEEETATTQTSTSSIAGTTTNTIGLPLAATPTTTPTTSGSNNSSITSKIINGNSADQFDTMWVCIERNETDYSDATYFSFFADATGYVLIPEDGTGVKLNWDATATDLNFTVNGLSGQYTYTNIQFTTDYQFTARATEDGVFIENDICALHTTDGQAVGSTSSTGTSTTTNTTGSSTTSTGGFNDSNSSSTSGSIQFANNYTSAGVEDYWFCAAESDSMIMIIINTGEGAIAFGSDGYDDTASITNWSASNDNLSLTLENSSRISFNDIFVLNNDTFSTDSMTYDNANYGEATCVRIDIDE